MEKVVSIDKIIPIHLSLKYVDQIVDLHNIAFHDFFLTSLGSNFLKIYYISCLKNNSTISLGVIDNNDKLLGFAIGTINSAGYHKNILLLNLFPFLFSLFKIILFRPKIILRLFFNLNKSPRLDDQNDYAELLSIAVLPKLRGSGVSKIILDNFEECVKDRQGTRVALTTDYYQNDSVIKFYQKNNYQVFYDFTTYPNRRMYKMIKNLN